MTTEEVAQVQGAVDQAFQFLGTQISYPALSPQRQTVDGILRALQTAAKTLDAEQKAQTGAGKGEA